MSSSNDGAHLPATKDDTAMEGHRAGTGISGLLGAAVGARVGACVNLAVVACVAGLDGGGLDRSSSCGILFLRTSEIYLFLLARFICRCITGELHPDPPSVQHMSVYKTQGTSHASSTQNTPIPPCALVYSPLVGRSQNPGHLPWQKHTAPGTAPGESTTRRHLELLNPLLQLVVNCRLPS